MEEFKRCFFLEYLPMDITLKSLGKAELPAFLGSLLRGVIGQTLRKDSRVYNYLYHNGKLNGNIQDVVKPYISYQAV